MTTTPAEGAARLPARMLLAAVGLVLALLLAACQTEGQAAVGRELNADRRAHGLATLPSHGTLDAKAQAWAAKLARDGRLSHSNLASGAPRCYRALGENVGFGPSAAHVQDGYMASSGHRANVLGRGWTDVGVGYARGRNGGVYTVQVFMTRC